MIAVVDSSTVIALVRGGVFEHLGQVFQPLLIGHEADSECQKLPQVAAALNQTRSGQPPFPVVVTLIARSRSYDPQLSMADVEGIEIALDRSAALLTQDDLQNVEAKSAGVKAVLHTFDLLEGFKHVGFIAQVRPVLEQMQRNGEQHSRKDMNTLLRRVREPLLP